jgi:hypothetical protein
MNTYVITLDVSSVSLKLQTQQSTHCTLRKNIPTYGPNSAAHSTLNSRNGHSYRGCGWDGICSFGRSKIDLWRRERGGGGGACHVIVVMLEAGREGGDVSGWQGSARTEWEVLRIIMDPGTREQQGDGNYIWRALLHCSAVIASLDAAEWGGYCRERLDIWQRGVGAKSTALKFPGRQCPRVHPVKVG